MALEPLSALLVAPPASDYRGLAMAASFTAVAGLFLAVHGAAPYALVVWEGTAGVLTWLYVDPVLGGFFFAALAFQFPLAVHLWGDPLSVRARVVRLLVGTPARRR